MRAVLTLRPGHAPFSDDELSHAMGWAMKTGQMVEIGPEGIALVPPEPAMPPLVPTYKGFVYVIRLRGFDLVKIGYSTDPARRRIELEYGSGMQGGMDLLFHRPGDGKMERQLHARFAEQRLYGEWFRLEGELAAWVEAGGAE